MAFPKVIWRPEEALLFIQLNILQTMRDQLLPFQLLCWCEGDQSCVHWFCKWCLRASCRGRRPSLRQTMRGRGLATQQLTMSLGGSTRMQSPSGPSMRAMLALPLPPFRPSGALCPLQNHMPRLLMRSFSSAHSDQQLHMLSAWFNHATAWCETTLALMRGIACSTSTDGRAQSVWHDTAGTWGTPSSGCFTAMMTQSSLWTLPRML